MHLLIHISTQVLLPHVSSIFPFPKSIRSIEYLLFKSPFVKLCSQTPTWGELQRPLYILVSFHFNKSDFSPLNLQVMGNTVSGKRDNSDENRRYRNVRFQKKKRNLLVATKQWIVDTEHSKTDKWLFPQVKQISIIGFTAHIQYSTCQLSLQIPNFAHFLPSLAFQLEQEEIPILFLPYTTITHFGAQPLHLYIQNKQFQRLVVEVVIGTKVGG